jgi:hypothetical protein
VATGTFKTYASFHEHCLRANIDFDSIQPKVLLASSSYTPNPDTHDFLDDVRSFEVTGTNWAANGQNSTATISIDAATNQVRMAFSDISVATVTLTDGKHAVVYNGTPGTDATRHLIGYVTFDTALAPTAGTLTIDFPTPSWYYDYT